MRNSTALCISGASVAIVLTIVAFQRLDVLTVLKLGGSLLTTAFAVYGIFNTYSHTDPLTGDKRVTAAGRIATIGTLASGLLTITVSAGEATRAAARAEAAKREMQDLSDRTSETLASQERLLTEQRRLAVEVGTVQEKTTQALDAIDRGVQQLASLNAGMKVSLEQQRRIRHQVLRPFYPLEPLTIEFETTFSMDARELSGYARRLRATVRDRDVFDVSTVAGGPPDIAKGESLAHELLFEDNTRFIFSFGTGPLAKNRVVLSSVPPSYATRLIPMPRKGELRQTIEIRADFGNRLFTKYVRCENPLRTGEDTLAMSALDLIGRRMTYDTIWTNRYPVGQVRQLTLIFGYESSLYKRYIAIPLETSAAVITADHLGLSEVLVDRRE